MSKSRCSARFWTQDRLGPRTDGIFPTGRQSAFIRLCVAALIDQENQAMPDPFDPYRESLVVESTTQWPVDVTEIDEPTRQRIAEALHADPASASHLEYVRTHTGFCRQITVTQEDIQRLG
jgi:hypothetical protein